MAVTAENNRFNEVIRAPRTTAMRAEDRQRLFDATNSHPPADYARVAETMLQQLAAIDSDTRFTAEAKRKMVADIKAAARKQLDPIAAAHRETSLRALGQEEGQARAALRNDPPSLGMASTAEERDKIRIRQQHEAAMLKRIDLDLRDLDGAMEFDDIAGTFDAAEASDGEVMRRVGRYALRRASAIFAEIHPKGMGAFADSAEGRRLADMRTRYATWEKANPTPVGRLQQAIQRRALREQELDAQQKRWHQAYGLED
jgi:hypothetical protein